MTPAKPPRRSVYADRLREFRNFAFGDADVFKDRGRWNDYFRERIGGRFTGRIILEIGSSDAELLASMAMRQPHHGFMGLDWKAKQTYLGAQRIAELGLRNVALLRTRAQEIACLFAPSELDEILVFHPEPCDRPEESNNRLLADAFLTDVHRVLKGESSLVLKTDHVGYYQWMLARLGVDENIGGDIRSGKVRVRDLLPPDKPIEPSETLRGRFEIAAASSDFWNDAGATGHTADRCFAGQTTMFERRFLKKKRPIYFLELRKRAPSGR